MHRNGPTFTLYATEREKGEGVGATDLTGVTGWYSVWTVWGEGASVAPRSDTVPPPCARHGSYHLAFDYTGESTQGACGRLRVLAAVDDCSTRRDHFLGLTAVLAT